MTQILVRKLDSDIKPKLKARAARNGRSLEEEVRVILRTEVDKSEESVEGFGTRAARLFKDVGLAPGEELERPKFLPWKPIDFDE